MAGFTPEQIAQLQALSSNTGTWASPNTAPIAPPAAPGPAPIATVPPADAAAIVPPVAPPAPPVQEPSVSAPAQSTAGLTPAAPVELPEQETTLPADVAPAAPVAPRNFEDAQSNAMGASKRAADAIRAEGAARERSGLAQAEVFERQANELKIADADFKREKAERQADYDEVKNQIALMQERNQTLNQITDRRTTTQKVLGILAQAGSSIADGLSRMGGLSTDFSGQMTKQLNDEIDRDIQRQKEAIEGRNKAVAEKLTELGLAKNALGDLDDAMQFATAQRQLRFAAEVKAQAARSGSAETKAHFNTAAAQLEEEAAQKLLALQEKLTEQKYRSRQMGARGAGGGGALDLATIRATVENGGTLTPAQFKAAKDMGLFKADGKTIDEIEQTPEGQRTPEEQTKLNKAKGQGGQTEGDLIAGYETIPGTQPLDKGNYGKAREIASGVSGVRSAGTRLADLYEQIAKNPSGPEADELRTRYWTTAGQFLTQRSLATGQGVVNKADAERDAQEGAVPPPPGSGDSYLAAFNQRWKGTRPSSGVIRQNTLDTVADGTERLRGYNLQPRAQRPQGGVAATGGETRAPTVKSPDGQTKFAPAPAGKVWVQNTETGAQGTIPVEKLEAALKSGKYARMVD